MQALNKIIIGKTKRLESPIEHKILNELSKYKNLDFETQHKIDHYRLDFAFPKHKIALEIDGNDYHSSDKQKIRDELRDEYLLKIKGWKTYRLEGWFCNRYPDIAVIKALEHIPEVHNEKTYIQAKTRMKAYLIGELINKGHKNTVIEILDLP